MLNFILRKLFSFFFTLLGLSFVVFIIIYLMPGDPAQVMLGERATADSIAKLREELGLNRPLIIQYLSAAWDLFTFDFGRSYQSNERIGEILTKKFPATFELTFFSLLISVSVGMLTGVIAASKKGSLFDGFSMIGALAGISMPIFWLALILMYVFSYQLGWFPVTGRLPAEVSFQPITHIITIDSLLRLRFDVFAHAIHHLILPSIALSTIPMAIIARITRASVIETLGEDYIRTARAKGLSENLIIFRHALRNALIPILTIIGLQFGLLLGGAIITETIFAWPGMGTLLLHAVNSRDYKVLQAGVFVVGFAFTLVNLTVDLTYGLVDPRVRSKSES